MQDAAIILGGEHVIKTEPFYIPRSSHQDDRLITTIFYDKNWQISDENNAVYKLSLVQTVTTPGTSTHVIVGDLTVTTIAGEEILSFPIAARAQNTLGVSR